MPYTFEEMQTFGDRMLLIQQTNELTQAGFAGALGIHVKSAQNYVRGKTVPDCHVVLALYKKFGVAPNWIVLGEGEMLVEEEGVSSRERKTLLGLFKTLDEGRRRILVDFLALLSRLHKIDRKGFWMRQAVGRGSIPLSYLAEIGRIIDAEWQVIKEFFWQERKVIEAEPTALEQKRDIEFSEEVRAKIDKGRKEATEAKSQFEDRLTALETMWNDVPEIDESLFPFVGLEEDQ